MNSGTSFRLECSLHSGVCIVFTLLSLHSEWSQGFHIHVSYEVRPSPDVAGFFFLNFFFLQKLGCVIFGTALFLLHSFHTAQDTGAMEGLEEDRRCLFFF